MNEIDFYVRLPVSNPLRQLSFVLFRVFGVVAIVNEKFLTIVSD